MVQRRRIWQQAVLLLALLSIVQARSVWPRNLKAAIAQWRLCPCKGQQSDECPDGFPELSCFRLRLQCICQLPFCNATTPCVSGTSCDSKWNKCFHSPKWVGDPCDGDRDCGEDLTCAPDTKLCIASVPPPALTLPPQLAPTQAPSQGVVSNRTTLVSESTAVTSPVDLPLGSTCSLTSQCAQGLLCDTCPGSNSGSVCRQGSWVMQQSDYDRPYNKVPWLVTHNAYAQNANPTNTWALPLFLNQDLSITDQLNYGARGLMLDVYLVNGVVYLCHSYCDFGKIPLSSLLAELKAWMDAHPMEIVTLFLEDYVSRTSPGKLTSAFSAAGLSQYLFPQGQMPTDGSDWPSVRAMASIGRLVVWSDARNGDFPWQWDYHVESMYGSRGMDSGTCTTRDNGSSDLIDGSKALVLVNWFGDLEDSAAACAGNRAVTLQAKLQACYGAAGGRWANFLAVDFFQHNNDGGVFKALDWLSLQWRTSAP